MIVLLAELFDVLANALTVAAFLVLAWLFAGCGGNFEVSHEVSQEGSEDARSDGDVLGVPRVDAAVSDGGREGGAEDMGGEAGSIPSDGGEESPRPDSGLSTDTGSDDSRTDQGSGADSPADAVPAPLAVMTFSGSGLMTCVGNSSTASTTTLSKHVSRVRVRIKWKFAAGCTNDRAFQFIVNDKAFPNAQAIPTVPMGETTWSEVDIAFSVDPLTGGGWYAKVILLTNQANTCSNPTDCTTPGYVQVLEGTVELFQ